MSAASKVLVIDDVVYRGPFSGLNDAMELRAWRLFGADVMPFLEAALAAQGDAPDSRLLSLQHSLADLLRSPANTFRSSEHHD
jgi:hypothetical protein